jgi:DnaJ-class molecular chaperone
MLLPVALSLDDLFLGARKVLRRPGGTLNLDIPPGMPHGHRHRIPASDRVGQDIVIEFQHDTPLGVSTKGLDIHIALTVPLREILHGGEHSLTLGPKTLCVTWTGYINPKQPLRLKGQGIPPSGDVLVTLDVLFPETWPPEQSPL